MKIWVQRHGEAESVAPSDAERALTAVGIRQIQAQGRRWSAGFKPQHIWVSPYLRAQQSAAHWLAAAELPTGAFPAPETVDWLLPDTPVMQVVDQLGLCSEQNTVLLVSHQPLVSELVSFLTGEPAWACGMGTGYLAEISLPLVARGMADTFAIHAPTGS